MSYTIIASNFKRKSLETEKVLKELVGSVSLVDDKNNDEHDDPFSSETSESLRSKYLIYEEKYVKHHFNFNLWK